MTRDYVPQMLEIQRAVLSQAETTKAMWQDDVAKRYYGDYVDCYEKYIDAYLRGGTEIMGKGLEELLEFFELVRAGEDPMKNEREIIQKKFVKNYDGKNGYRIKEFLKDKFREKNSICV